MADTLQTRAIAGLNTVQALMQQMSALLGNINQFVRQYNNEGFNTVWQNLATCAQGTDGSLGTADGTPNTAHPIDNRVNTGVNRAASAATYINAVAAIEQFQNFCNGSAVTTNNYGTTIDQLSA